MGLAALGIALHSQRPAPPSATLTILKGICDKGIDGFTPAITERTRRSHPTCNLGTRQKHVSLLLILKTFDNPAEAALSSIMRANIQIEVPPGPFAGYIFDCDGTLIDSMMLHLQAWNQSVREHGGKFQLTPESFMRVAGVGGIDTVRRFNEWSGDHLDPVAVFERKEEIYLALLDGGIEQIDEVVAIARHVARKVPVSVASGGPRNVVRTALAKSGLLSLFPVIVTQSDVTHSKPHPEIFLLAAERMGVPAENCIVFEDSPLGIAGAHAAGMQSVLIPNLMLTRTV